MIDALLSNNTIEFNLLLARIGYYLILLGALVLTASIVPLSKLVKRLPTGGVRYSWVCLIVLVGFFILGYIAYSQHLHEYHHIQDISVPIIFFCGGVFVFAVSLLALKTADDVMQVYTLKQESITDPLMQIFNRRYLDKRLQQEVERSRRFHHPLAIVLIDIDHFKRVNDSYGHLVGDLVLQKTAKVISDTLRDSDVVARYGGEELVAILPRTNNHHSLALAERLRLAIANHTIQTTSPCGNTKQTINVTVSIGVATLNPNNKNYKCLIECADNALYRAKEDGRNRVMPCKYTRDDSTNCQLVTATTDSGKYKP